MLQDRRRVLGMLGGALAAASVPAFGQPSPRRPRVAWLGMAGKEVGRTFLTPFLEGMAAFGYVEGRNLELHVRWGENSRDTLERLALEALKLKPAVFVTQGPALHVARKLPGTTPVGLLKEAVPSATRTALLWNPQFPGMRLYGVEVDRVAPTLGMSIEYFDATTPVEVAAALRRIAASRAQALFVAYDSIIGLRMKDIAAFAIQRRMVSFGSSPVYALQGGCLAYGPDLADISERTASHVDRILRGAKPAAIPVEEPRKMQLVLNLKTARAIGYTPPAGIVARADVVIE